jgi:hypothetical protein
VAHSGLARPSNNPAHDALHAIERGAAQGLLEVMTGGLCKDSLFCGSKTGRTFEALDNGILKCANPKRLQAICDGLSAFKVSAARQKCAPPTDQMRHPKALGFFGQLIPRGLRAPGVKASAKSAGCPFCSQNLKIRRARASSNGPSTARFVNGNT